MLNFSVVFIKRGIYKSGVGGHLRRSNFMGEINKFEFKHECIKVFQNAMEMIFAAIFFVLVGSTGHRKASAMK